MARDIRRSREAAEGKQPTVADLPDYTLSGKLIEVRSHASNVRQFVYAFQLSLTDSRTGNAVWEKSKDIIKQGTKSSIGY
jgi:PBP1b-binding outer membrane lipoprotein LpoB